MTWTILKAALAGAAIVLILLTTFGTCNDTGATVANAVAAERVRVADSVKAEFEPVIERLRDSVTVRVDTVRRFSTRWDTITRTDIDTVYAVDSSGAAVPAVPLHQYEAVVATGDSLEAACSLLANTCEALKDSVPKLIELYQRASDARDSLIAHPKPFRRWSVCAAGGYGAALSEGGVRTGPSLNVGVCYRIF